jgi:TolB protein
MKIKIAFLLSSLALPLWGQTTNNLGMFEDQSDVGNPALAGSASFDPASKQYTVSGGGANMWAAKDEFHFVWRRVSGDFSLTATVHFPVQKPPSHRKAALMARQSLDEDAAYADAVIHGSGLTELQFRNTAGDVTHAVNFPVTGPVQIRLERKQGWFTMSAANEGQPLQELGSYALKLTDPIYLGLAVCAHNPTNIETAVFSDVNFIEIPASRSQKKEN